MTLEQYHLIQPNHKRMIEIAISVVCFPTGVELFSERIIYYNSVSNAVKEPTYSLSWNPNYLVLVQLLAM